jgi:DNA-binding NarL/FixJ family response regulator
VTEALTPRERDVLALLAAGCDSKTIATRLGLSVHTARDHVQSVLEKMDAHSRIEAVVRAGELGLVRL